MMNERTHWEERYAQGFLPWDSGITPPEIEAFWQSERILPQQLAATLGARPVAIDMGCGTGTNVAFLARQGMHAIGVELAGNALEVARTRLRQRSPELLLHVDFIQASVMELPLGAANAHYMMDVGCFHNMPLVGRPLYAQGVTRNLAPGGYYQLYAFDWMPERANDPNKSPRGMRENEVAELFAPHLEVIEILRANPNPKPCRWYLLRKKT
ncbi:MAG: class I SAM-dependent methyltransferase [Caldilineaceae bacterium]